MITATESREELEALTVVDLRRLASELEIKGRSKLKKSRLIEAILRAAAGGEYPVAGEPTEIPDRAPDAILPPPSPRSPRRAAKDRVDASQRCSAEVLPVDPRRVFACWAFDPSLLEELRSEWGAPQARLVLRLRDVTLIEFDERRSFGGLSVELAEPSGRCYVDVFPGRTYRAELGLRADEEFRATMPPLFVETPSETLSLVDREELVGVIGQAEERWEGRVSPAPVAVEGIRKRMPMGMFDDDRTRRAAPKGVEAHVRGGYLPVGRAASESASESASEAATGSPSSFDLAALGCPSSFDLGLQSLVERAPSSELRIDAPLDEETSARLEVHADLVVYGRARPGTKLVIEGVEVPVREDGTFDLRLALHPGKRMTNAEPD